MNETLTVDKKSQFPLVMAALLGGVLIFLAVAIFAQYRVHRTGLAL